MKERNGLKVMLGIVGLLAWMAYILACRASWSPDGSKVLFPYYNPEAEETGVALGTARVTSSSRLRYFAIRPQGCSTTLRTILGLPVSLLIPLATSAMTPTSIPLAASAL